MVSSRAPKPCYQLMERQTKEREELYWRRELNGENIPINDDPFDVCDDVPQQAEIRQGVWKLRRGRASGASGIRAKHIKGWLGAVEESEKEGTDPGEDEV